MTGFFTPDEIAVNADYLGAGYGIMGEPEREAIRLAAETEGLLLDPVYTGRAFAGVIDLIPMVGSSYLWDNQWLVLRSDAAFEEASAEHAEQQAHARAAARTVVKGTAATPFSLAPGGPPETAILWKNLIMVGRYLSLRTVLRLLPLVIVFGVFRWQARRRAKAAVLVTCRAARWQVTFTVASSDCPVSLILLCSRAQAFRKHHWCPATDHSSR